MRTTQAHHSETKPIPSPRLSNGSNWQLFAISSFESPKVERPQSSNVCNGCNWVNSLDEIILEGRQSQDSYQKDDGKEQSRGNEDSQSINKVFDVYIESSLLLLLLLLTFLLQTDSFPSDCFLSSQIGWQSISQRAKIFVYILLQVVAFSWWKT